MRPCGTVTDVPLKLAMKAWMIDSRCNATQPRMSVWRLRSPEVRACRYLFVHEVYSTHLTASTQSHIMDDLLIIVGQNGSSVEESAKRCLQAGGRLLVVITSTSISSFLRRKNVKYYPDSFPAPLTLHPCADQLGPFPPRVNFSVGRTVEFC